MYSRQFLCFSCRYVNSEQPTQWGGRQSCHGWMSLQWEIQVFDFSPLTSVSFSPCLPIFISPYLPVRLGHKTEFQSANKLGKDHFLLDVFNPDTQPWLTPLWLLFANRDSVKKWCRSGDWSSCLVTDSEGIYEDTSVAISDDRTGAFTVTLKKLQMRDGGWYWCSAGQQKIAVQVSVTPRPTTSRFFNLSGIKSWLLFVTRDKENQQRHTVTPK